MGPQELEIVVDSRTDSALSDHFDPLVRGGIHGDRGSAVGYCATISRCPHPLRTTERWQPVD